MEENFLNNKNDNKAITEIEHNVVKYVRHLIKLKRKIKQSKK